MRCAHPRPVVGNVQGTLTGRRAGSLTHDVTLECCAACLAAPAVALKAAVEQADQLSPIDIAAPKTFHAVDATRGHRE
jgi:hypothetical protein